MSELKVDKFTGVATAGSILVTGEGNSTTTNLQQGLCKCWNNFDALGTFTLQDSFNCSSISDSGTGNSVITMTNAMSNDDYSCTASSGIPANSGYCDVSNSSTSTYTLRSFNIVTSTATITIADVADNSCTVNGDLA